MKKRNREKFVGMRHQDHPRPATRREFLAQGMVQASSFLMMPAILKGMFGSEIAQAVCPSSGNLPGLLPLIILDMAGGAGLHGNFIAGKEGGAQDYLSSYMTMGVPFNPGSTPGSVDTRFGAPMWTTVSNIRKGMLGKMSTQAMANTSIMTVCHTSADDSKGNRHSPLILASKAGAAGTVLRTGVGLGGNSSSPIVDQSLIPFQMRSPTSLRDLFGYGSVSVLDTDPAKQAFSAAIHKLGQAQAPLLQPLANAAGLNNAFECAHLAQGALVGNLAALDARLDPAVQAVYGVTATSTDTTSVRAAVAYHVLQGHTGPGVIQIGGCDYHTSDRTTGNTKDEEIGVELGRILELARRLGKGVVVVGISDGSVYSSQTVLDPVTQELAWIGDAGSKGMSFLACYKTTGKPTVQKSQIGHFLNTSNPGADRSTFFGSNPAMVANILFANYLNLSGKLSLFDSVVAAAAFPRAEMTGILGLG